MRVFIAVLVLIFSLQSWTKADDISDFEIEGMSVGDSLLDYFTEEEINNFVLERFPKDDFVVVTVESEKFENYDAMQFDIKPNDSKYILYGVVGMIGYEKDIKSCYQKMDEIVDNFSSVLKNFHKVDHGRLNNPVGADPYGGTYDLVTFDKNKFGKSERVQVSCNDWSEKGGIVDSVKVEIYSKELAYFIDYIAYN